VWGRGVGVEKGVGFGMPVEYVSMELAQGKLPDGKTYIFKEPLLECRAQVPSATR